MRFLIQLRTGPRLYAGFGVVLGLMALTAAIGILGLGQVAGINRTALSISKTGGGVIAFQNDFTELRRQARVYVMEGDEAARAAAGKLADQLQTQGGELEAAFLSPERRAMMTAVRQGVATYKGLMGQAFALRQETDQLLSQRLDPQPPLIAAALDKAVAAAGPNGALFLEAEVLIQTARARAQRFLSDPSPALRDEVLAGFESALGKTQAAMRQAPAAREAGEGVLRALTAYRDGFAAVAAAKEKTNQLIDGAMKREAGDIAQQVSDLRAAQAKAIDLNTAAAEATEGWATTGLWLITLAALALGSGAALLIARSVALPVTGMTEAMKRLAAGDLDADIPARDRVDEIGTMAQAVEVFKENAIARLAAERDREAARLREEQAKEAERAREAADLAAREARASALEQAVADFSAAVGQILDALGGASTRVGRAGADLTQAMGETTRNSASVAAAATQAAANVQGVAGATEEISSSVQEVTRQIDNSAAMTREAVGLIGRTREEVSQLAVAGDRIGEIVRLIADIAAKTDLLALNATIEAARAGAAGRGFAVVAGEVKSLAAHAARATEEIEGQVKAIQSATREAVNSIITIAGTVEKIDGIVASIAAAAEEQGAATSEIARNTAEAATGTSDVSRMIENVSATAPGANDQAASVVAASGDLAD